MADRLEKIAQLAAERENAVAFLTDIYGSSVEPKALAGIVETAFMRGAWSGLFHGTGPVFDLGERDKQELLDRIAERRAREAEDPEHQAFLARIEGRRLTRANAEPDS